MGGSNMILDIPEWVTYPDDDWASIAPGQAGLDSDAFGRFVEGLHPTGADFGGEDHTGGKWGAVVTRGGYLLFASTSESVKARYSLLCKTGGL